MSDLLQDAPARPARDARSAGTLPRHGPITGRGPGRRKVCPFCMDSIHHVDYKDEVRIRKHIGDHGNIEPRRRFGTCARHQRSLTVAVRRARYIGLVPVTSGAPRN